MPKPLDEETHGSPRILSVVFLSTAAAAQTTGEKTGVNSVLGIALSVVCDHLRGALDDASQKKLDKLRNAKPADFAGEYDPIQASALGDATSLFERYAEGGDDPKLRIGLAKPSRPAASSGDGAGHEQEPQVILKNPPIPAGFLFVR
jgi:hypothetical protein